ncbi:response regulator [Achromobacter deleyi]|uniref:response regulator n=1 Tax=Achromobacter deleyi TaxID=1353891 RepID=UPI00149108CC|nr:response regulator transcription factor [Achromobacter deleyi]QVQ25954.1 response regulator transcription factor [Achromobacter deleyi]UIP21495.1 response regulator transcription factor [Achromobacter deleyi]
MSFPPPQAPLRILIADDHGIVREGLRMMLAQAQALVGAVDEAGTGEQVLALLAAHGADLLVLDLGMPGVSGSGWVRALRARYPALHIMVLTANTDERTRIAVLEAGADAFLAKTGNSQPLLAAIAELAGGAARPRAARATHAETPDETLTRREQQVLAMAALGATAAQIAQDLHISPYTARKHRENLMRKLGLHSTAELVAYAVRLGLPTG